MRSQIFLPPLGPSALLSARGNFPFQKKTNCRSVLPLFCKSSTFDSSIGLARGVKYVKRHVHFDRFSSMLVKKIADMKAEVMILTF